MLINIFIIDLSGRFFRKGTMGLPWCNQKVDMLDLHGQKKNTRNETGLKERPGLILSRVRGANGRQIRSNVRGFVFYVDRTHAFCRTHASYLYNRTQCGI